MDQATDNFFNSKLQDKEVASILNQELDSYNQRLMLIASENFTSRAVLEAQGSVLTNKYAEGYPGKRYYGGCESADAAESLAVERLCKLFDVKFANVQSHSGSQANQAVLLALLSPGDTYLAMNLGAGGHLTHGSPVNLSGRWFNPVHYGVNDKGLIDYDLVRDLALKHKPKVIICGASSYSRLIDFQKFREIADEVSAYLWADIAHYSGLIAAKQWPNPAEHVHVMTTTTHKTLRGPRGGAIMTNDAELAIKLDRAVFPGLQGGPLVHVMAAKAVAFGLALQPSFTTYIKQVIANAKTLAAVLQDRGLQVVSGGTDCHMFLVNLVSLHLTGADTVALLDKANLIVNKNVIPFEKLSPRLASGFRIGTPTCTSRGMGKEEFTLIGELIAELVTGLAEESPDLSSRIAAAKQQVQELAARFPVYKFRH